MIFRRTLILTVFVFLAIVYGIAKVYADCIACYYPSAFNSDTIAHSRVSTAPGVAATQLPWDFGKVGLRFSNYGGHGIVPLCVDNSGKLVVTGCTRGPLPGPSSGPTLQPTAPPTPPPTPTPGPTPSPGQTPTPVPGAITYNIATACTNHIAFANNGLPTSGNAPHGEGEFILDGLDQTFWGGPKTRSLSPSDSWNGFQVSWRRHQYDTNFGDPTQGAGFVLPIVVANDGAVSGSPQGVRIAAYPVPSPIATSLDLMANDQWPVTSAAAPFNVPTEGGSLVVNVNNVNSAQNLWKVGIGYSGAPQTFIGKLTSGGAAPGSGTGGSNPWTISNVHIYAGSAGTTLTPGLNDEGGFRAYNFPDYYSGVLDAQLNLQYGFFVARLRLPAYAPAISPAFWTLQTGGVPNPPSGLQRNEDDIEEMFGNTYGNALNAGQIRWNTSPSQFFPTPTGVYNWFLAGDPSTAYHDYGVLLANGSTTFYLDGNPIGGHSGGPDWTNGVADKEVMLMFQVGAPGSWLDPSSQGASNAWPLYLWAQWERIYTTTGGSC